MPASKETIAAVLGLGTHLPKEFASATFACVVYVGMAEVTEGVQHLILS